MGKPAKGLLQKAWICGLKHGDGSGDGLSFLYSISNFKVEPV